MDTTNTNTNEIIRDDLPRMVERLERVKIPHAKERVVNVVYADLYGIMDWINNRNDSLKFTPTVKGIYRLTIISDEQFNITSSALLERIDNGNTEQIINLVMLINNKATFNATYLTIIPIKIAPVKDTVIRKSITWTIELVEDLSKQVN